MNILVYEDSQVEKLSPITTARPAFCITCGCLRLVDFLNGLDGVTVVASVRKYLAAIVQIDHEFLSSDLDRSTELTVVVNARCVPSQSNFSAICDMRGSKTKEPLYDELGNVAIAIVPTSDLLTNDDQSIGEKLIDIVGPKLPASKTVETFGLPHDVIKFNELNFNENLEWLIRQKSISQTRDGVFLADDAQFSENVEVDTSNGAVVIDAGAKIKPFAYLRGPLYVGPNCTVNEHSSIKDYVCLTNTIKAGGEIEASVIEPYSNKQHHGFLGHSYLGSWINLGAGTCNSDLKNTYGQVSAIYTNEKVATGMQFVGCFVGDYSKSAINTSIYTGKSIGVCSMLYGIVPTNVPSFTNYAKIFDQLTEIPAAVMLTTQKRMFGRRDVDQRPCDIQLMNDMFELTKNERELENVVQGQLNF